MEIKSRTIIKLISDLPTHFFHNVSGNTTLFLFGPILFLQGLSPIYRNEIAPWPISISLFISHTANYCAYFLNQIESYLNCISSYLTYKKYIFYVFCDGINFWNCSSTALFVLVISYVLIDVMLREANHNTLGQSQWQILVSFWIGGSTTLLYPWIQIFTTVGL